MDEDDDLQEKPSKSQLKRDAEDLQELGNSLVKLPLSVVSKFPLADDLLEAIKLARSIRKNGALKRQLQFIGKLMRHNDTDKIRVAYDNYFSKLNQHKDKFHLYENWRDKFLNNEPSVFNDFLAQYPQVDRQRLRQLQRNAITEIKNQKAPKSSRLLFQLIKHHVDLHETTQESSNDNLE